MSNMDNKIVIDQLNKGNLVVKGDSLIPTVSYLCGDRNEPLIEKIISGKDYNYTRSDWTGRTKNER